MRLLESFIRKFDANVAYSTKRYVDALNAREQLWEENKLLAIALPAFFSSVYE